MIDILRFAVFGLALLAPSIAMAQVFADDKNCITVKNMSQHTITGDFVSDTYEKESEWGATMVSNRHKFKVDRNETQKICPAGPYFSGPSIEFVIRRAWPVFRCKAVLGQRLTVLSTVRPDGGEVFNANCF